MKFVRGDTHMTSTLTEGGGKNKMLSDGGGWGVCECSERPIFIFLLKNIGFAA